MFLDKNLTDYISPIHVEFVEHPDLTCQWKLMKMQMKTHACLSHINMLKYLSFSRRMDKRIVKNLEPARPLRRQGLKCECSH